MKFLIIFCSILFMSCGSNISKEKMNDYKNKINEWEKECVKFKEILKKISQMEKMIIDNEQNMGNEKIREIIKENQELKSQINEIIKKNYLMDSFGRSYETIDLIYNKINTFYYKIIGDKDKIEMYQFEKIWFLPKSIDNDYMGYGKICNIQIEN